MGMVYANARALQLPLLCGATMRPQEIVRLLSERARLSAQGDSPAWKEFHENCARRVTIYLPLGEMTNPTIAGLLWAWGHAGLDLVPFAEVDRIIKANRLAAQGIEGIVRIRGSLGEALLCAQELGAFRIGVEEAR